MKKDYSIEFVHPIYTGGGIYVFVGKTDKGFFLATDEYCSVVMVNASPYCVDSNGYYVMDDVFYEDWQQEHLIEELETQKAFRFVKRMYKWIIKNQPHDDITNYSIEDMKYALDNIGEVRNDGMWY